MAKNALSKILGLNQSTEENEQIIEINISKIKANPYQPRKHFDPLQLEDLSKSIREFGVIQPVVVRDKGEYFELVAGERRLRASQKIGLSTIPAIVRSLSDKEAAEIALIENLQRADLNYFEEAEGYKHLLETFSLTQEEIAKRVGKSQSTIANKLRILKLSNNVKDNINSDIITERHARALLKLPDEQCQLEVLKEIYEKELNVRETDQYIENYIRTKEEDNAQQNRKSKIIRIFKDMRIYLNTIRTAVKTIEEAGIEIETTERDYDTYIEVVLKMHKKKR